MLSESSYCEKMLSTLVMLLKQGRSKCSRSCFCNALILEGDQGNWGGLRKSTDSPEGSRGLQAPHHVQSWRDSVTFKHTWHRFFLNNPSELLPLRKTHDETGLLNLAFQTHPQRNRGIFYTLFSPNGILVFALTLEAGADVPGVCLGSWTSPVLDNSGLIPPQTEDRGG